MAALFLKNTVSGPGIQPRAALALRGRLVPVLALLAFGAAIVAAQVVSPGRAGADAEVAAKARSTTLVLAGSPGPTQIRISLDASRRNYVIDSNRSLEGAGGVCTHSSETSTRLICRSGPIAGFLFNGGPGDDTVIVERTVGVPVTLKGGLGDDLLIGGSGDDKLLGGAGNDKLLGRMGSDLLYGGPGRDLLFGGSGGDVCNGGAGRDLAASSCDVRRRAFLHRPRGRSR